MTEALVLGGYVAVGLIAGLCAGLFHFASLWWSTRLLLTGGAARAAGIQLARFAVAGAVLTPLAKLGASALLGGALGVLLAQRPLVRHFGELN